MNVNVRDRRSRRFGANGTKENRMSGRLSVVLTTVLVTAASATHAANHDPVVVTSSNTVNNQLLVFDTAGALIESVPTLGQGGVENNAGGVAAGNGLVAVVNHGSHTVSVFSRGENGFEFRQLLAVVSPPVSVAFSKDHLYVLGTTTVESHRLGIDGIDTIADGVVPLVAADGSAAQVGVAGDRLIVTEKSGTIEVVQLEGGAGVGSAVPVALPEDSRDTPFGLVTRGSNAYVTIAHSDLIALVKNARLITLTATGSPGGEGQHSPCWLAVVGPYLYSSNSPSRSISRLVAGGNNIVVDLPVAAQTVGAPVDIAAVNGLLVVVESNAGGTSHLTQFRIDEDGNLAPTTSTAIASAANGVVIVSEN
jgi:hypothetical protein